jgi:two-component system sensor histidine kinase ChvG
MVQIGKEQHMRVRMYDAQGKLWADSFKLARALVPVRRPGSRAVERRTFARGIGPGGRLSRRRRRPARLRRAGRGTRRCLARGRSSPASSAAPRSSCAARPTARPVITAAAPVGLNGSTLLTTRNAADITQAVRDARTSLLKLIALALVVSIVLSLYLARTIINPLRRLGGAAVRVRLGRDREVEVPRMQQRGDEIGVLARAVSDMTAALRQRIDAVEVFGADLAHEIKNPFASLRSAIESLLKVKDEKLRAQLSQIAVHDVRRIDRLVTEISEASRIDAELSRATFEPIDLAALIENLVQAREDRGLKPAAGSRSPARRRAARSGRAAADRAGVENLLDNAVSFSPEAADRRRRARRRDAYARACATKARAFPSRDARRFPRFHSVRPRARVRRPQRPRPRHRATIAEAHDGSLTSPSGPTASPAPAWCSSCRRRERRSLPGGLRRRSADRAF